MANLYLYHHNMWFTNQASLAEKATLVAWDMVTIWDSADSNNPKKFDIGTLAESAITSAERSKLSWIEEWATVDQTDAEIATAYGNVVWQVSGAEITAGTETALRTYSPADVVSFISQHGWWWGWGANHFMFLEWYRWRARYNYGYTFDEEGNMYEYSSELTTVSWEPYLNYANAVYRCKKTGNATNWEMNFIFDWTATLEWEFELHLYKIQKINDSISSTATELAVVTSTIWAMTARRWYEDSWTFDSPISLTEWDMLALVIVQKAPNDTTFRYLEDFYFKIY